jgi:hypothetical protein
MKVKLGPFKEHISTHKIKRKYLKLMYGDVWFEIEEPQYIWLDHLVVGLLDAVDFCLEPLNKINQRKVKVKYHNYDTWNLDHTLALIILPGLKQLKAENHGYPSVNPDDLPTACLKDAEGSEQWEWVMDEMIWAFNEIANDYPGENTFYTGNVDIIWKKEDGLSHMEHGPNHTFSIDFDSRKKYDDRIQRGLILFGKYYRNLWD